MNGNKKVGDVVQLVKRLQTFDLDEMLDGVAKIPKGVVEIRTRDLRRRRGRYQTVSVSIRDEEALKRLDVDKYEEVLTPQVAKAARLLKDKMSFDPVVLREAKNYLPHGMLDMAVGAPDTAAGIFNFNFNCRKLEGTQYDWPVPIDELEGIGGETVM
jgi:hypothetical protein